MDHSKGRKKWSSGGEPQMPIHAPAVTEEIPPQYEHYLHLLQERNRLVRKLRQKDKKDIELEKKEKGFTLYLNNSFSAGKDCTNRTERAHHRPLRAKTAAAADERIKWDYGGRNHRRDGGSRSARPAGDKRRNWQIGSVEFTTADGQRQRVKAPEKLTGKYTDDFESDDLDSDDHSEVVHSMSSLEIGDDVNASTSSVGTARKPKTSYVKRVATAKREELETENRVTIKMEDIKKLRESLQMNKFIRQSLAMDNDSDVEEEIAEEITQDVSDGERISPVMEEIEEMISSEDENPHLGKEDKSVRPLKLFKPGDTLVLEFQPLPVKSKGSTHIAGARRKTDSEVSAHSSNKPTSALSPRSTPTSSKRTTASNWESKSGSTRSSRPLSSNVTSSDSRQDSKEEASAVLKALQEENKQVEKFSKTSSRRPLPQPKSSSHMSKSPSAPKPDKAKLPSPVKSSSDPDQTGSRENFPASPAQQDRGDNPDIDSVISRVLKMNPKQQKQLLQTLNHIDVDDHKISVSKDSHSLNTVSNSWSSKAPVTDSLEVTVEILSNWGHSSCVGLTELQFFSQSGCLIPIQPSDVSVYGARAATNRVEVLFNGKSKTTKERNMWSCRFDGKPIEFSILMMNPTPGKPLRLGSVKVWNWNNKISNLDIGARQMRIFFGGELLFSGEVDKGCGNQVFDYSKHVLFELPHQSSQPQAHKAPAKSSLALNLTAASGRPSNSACTKATEAVRDGVSGNGLASPGRVLVSPTKAEGQGAAASRSHHTFRSISRSSQSSASSSGSAKIRGHSEERLEDKGGEVRSETRTLVRPAVLNRRGSGGSGKSSPEVDLSDNDLSRMPEKKRAQTPLKSKRVAAKLSGRSSQTEHSAKSNADSFESKPPLPPTHKSDDKSTTSSRSVERSSTSKSKSKLSPKSSRSEPHMSPGVPTANTASTASQGLCQGNPNLVEQIKHMGTSENKRKKEIPKWLKGDGATESTIADNKMTPPAKGDKKQGEDEIEKQLEEEFERFSQAGSESQSKVGKSMEEEVDVLTPMKKIEKSRAKWRKEKDLEESWGSLSFFNKSHRGRVSVDMADEELEEYLSTSKKPASEKSAAAPKLSLPNDSWSDEDSDFTIPELPSGQELVINIKTTWGDHHYVGLTGVQLFSSQGEQVPVAKVWADPSDINILPEYNRDPRVVTNIIDNVNRTRDDVHMWLAPFSPGKNHFVYISFARPCQLALMRIWNYNKSRIHSFRGAKDVIISLDGTDIFKGEIARACGGIEGGTEAFGDTILFTTDESILEAVSKNDDAFEGEMLSEDEDVTFERPSTADADDDTRPLTRAAGVLPAEKNDTSTARPATSFVTNVGDVLVYKANKLELLFTSTWGDHHYLGLTGLELVGSDGEGLPLTLDMLTATPRDLRHLAGNEKDDRTLDKLLDGINVTCQDSHMWLIPFTQGQSHTVTATFSQPTLVTGLRIWNYNKSPEDTYRGAKVMHVQINDRTVSPPEGYLLRKGPGICHFDFAQEISFSNTSQAQGVAAVSEGSSGGGEQNYESVVQMPRGFIFQLQLFSSWGDQYYLGMNGLEFYDAAFHKIELTQTNIAAYPDSVNVLDNVSNDARTPDKLIDGFNDTNDGRHMWLAPILPSIINRIYVIFDQPTSVSMIKLWNYSKTVSRGVKDFALLVDDLLVYNGTLQAVSAGAKGILPTCSASIPHHTVLFSDNKDILRKEKNAIISNQTEDQDIQMLNDKQVVSKFAKASSSKPVNQALRPRTSVTKTARR